MTYPNRSTATESHKTSVHIKETKIAADPKFSAQPDSFWASSPILLTTISIPESRNSAITTSNKDAISKPTSIGFQPNKKPSGINVAVKTTS